MNFNTVTLLRLLKKKILIIRSNSGPSNNRNNTSNFSNNYNNISNTFNNSKCNRIEANTVWSNREFSSIVVALVNDVAGGGGSARAGRYPRDRAMMIRKKKKCVHYTQLEKDLSDSPIRSTTPKEVKVNEVTQEFIVGGDHGDEEEQDGGGHDVRGNHDAQDG